jgi:AcrR family transcriptional regulator
MNMANAVELIKDRQVKSNLSVEKYANQIGITAATLYHYFSRRREQIDTTVLQQLGKFYAQEGDVEALSALASYALDVKGEFMPAE